MPRHPFVPLSVAVVSVAAGLVALAAPASAAPRPCGTYPPGQGYALSRAPHSGQVRAGTTIVTRGTLRRGHESCVGFTLGRYTKTPRERVYHLNGSGVTDGTGSVRLPLTITATTRMFYNLNVGRGYSRHSGISEFVVRR